MHLPARLRPVCATRSWDDGLDGAALCHDLFGVYVCASAAHGPACVRFLCGPPRDAKPKGVVLQLFVDHAYCHAPSVVAGIERTKELGNLLR